MMANKLIKLKLTNEQNCFLSIPRSWKDEIQAKSWFYFEMTNLNNSTKIYLEWSGNCVLNDDYVELSATFAMKLGFVDNQTVLINLIEKEITKANEIIIQPSSEFDWENFRLYSNDIESNFLNQVKIVWKDLILPIWPRPDVCIYLKIHFKDTAQHLLRCETFTELIGVIDEREINQLQQSSNKSPDQQIKEQQQSNESTFASIFKYLPQIKLTNSNGNQRTNQIQSTKKFHIFFNLFKTSSNVIFNVVNGKRFTDSQSINLNKLNTVFVNSNQFNADHKDRSIGELVRLLSPQELSIREELMNKKGHEKNDLNEENQYLKTMVEIEFIDQCPLNCLIACNSLTLQLDLYPFSKVMLSSVDKLSKQVDGLNQDKKGTNSSITLPGATSVSFSIYQTIVNLDQISSSISSFIKDYCLKHDFLVLNRSTLIICGNHEFTFQPEFNQNDYAVLLKESVQNRLEIRILNQQKTKLKTSWNVELPKKNLDQVLRKSVSYQSAGQQNCVYRFDNYRTVREKCSKMITECFDNVTNRPFDQLTKSRRVLVYGKKGCGKTTLINDLMNEFNLREEQCSLMSLDCSKLKGKKIDQFKKHLYNSLNESIYAQPCLLIIENLHILLPKNSNIEQEHKLDLLYNQKVKYILVDLIENYLNESAYGIQLFTIITSRCDDLFDDQNLEFDLFDQILELKAPSPSCSINIINHLIKIHLKDYQIDFNQIDFDQLTDSLKTELTDYLPLDLNVIAERMIMNLFDESFDDTNRKISLKIDDYLRSFEDYIPFNLRTIKSARNKSEFQNKRLDDLGGLEKVKERLRQIILWPIRYPKLFENYPIDPQTCVLLYGMPGTGKTFLAQALANEFKINFISIKGPEILSKYIGASEQKIRELFEKANLSKPCILFFDEFDSIVPPRQNSNTDVTDRIVNQILTQMDGIENLQEGIYILAATSRPDMIDPAILRPGRFDVCLECNLPTQNERQQILNLLTRQIYLDDDVDLIEIANQTVNYTGSDLNTLIINATNQAISELINLDDELNVRNHDEVEQNLTNLKLNNSHFQLALQSTHPTFSTKEIHEYNKLFAKLKSDDSYDKKEIDLSAKSIFAS